MSEREAFGPNLRRLRVQRGISLEQIAAATKVSVDLWSGLERSDLSLWPTGIYARAYVRAYATQIGVDPDTAVDTFCRLFPNGDRRAERLVRDQAALVGHDLRWEDDLAGSRTAERRAGARANRQDVPALAIGRTGRVVAAAFDIAMIVATASAIRPLMSVGWAIALASSSLAYHAVSIIALGSTPSVWAIDTYLSSRHPTSARATSPRFLRLLQHKRTLKSEL
jgi:transcriptional regulator with XRE-family HTH domain